MIFFVSSYAMDKYLASMHEQRECTRTMLGEELGSLLVDVVREYEDPNPNEAGHHQQYVAQDGSS